VFNQSDQMRYLLGSLTAVRSVWPLLISVVSWENWK